MQGHSETNFGDGCQTMGNGPFVGTIPANTQTHVRISPVRVRAAVIPERRLLSLFDDSAISPTDLNPIVQSSRNLPEAARLIDIIWHASADRSPSSNLVIDGAFMQLVGQLLHDAGHGSITKPAAAIGDARLSRAVDYLETHIAMPLTVGELATVAGMSTSAFARSFRTATGLTVWSYVQHRRIIRAYEKVTLSDTQMGHIALDSNLLDVCNLSQILRAVCRKSPSATRCEGTGTGT